MENEHNSLAVDALERALLLIDRQKVVAAWSDKNQNKKMEQSRIDAESARLRSLYAFLKHNGSHAPVIYKEENAHYRGKVEMYWGRVLDFKERIFALFGGEVRYRAIVLTEGATGRVIQSMTMSVGTKAKDEAVEAEKKAAKAGLSDEFQKVMESEPLEAEIKGDGSNDSTGGASRDT
jgi:hypothetical protein